MAIRPILQAVDQGFWNRRRADSEIAQHTPRSLDRRLAARVSAVEAIDVRVGAVVGARPHGRAELFQPLTLPVTEWFAREYALHERLHLLDAAQVQVVQEAPCVRHVRDAGGSHTTWSSRSGARSRALRRPRGRSTPPRTGRRGTALPDARSPAGSGRGRTPSPAQGFRRDSRRVRCTRPGRRPIAHRNAPARWR